MNIFEESIRNGKISSELDLRRLFWKLAKELHPDVSSVDNNQLKFIKLKDNFDKAIELLSGQNMSRVHNVKPSRDFNDFITIFSELIASNFPVPASVKSANKLYQKRILEANAIGLEINPDCKDLMSNVEKELLSLRGHTTIANHPYNLIKLQLNRFSDYFYLKDRFSLKYLNTSQQMISEVLRSRSCPNTVRLVEWLLFEANKLQHK